MKTFVYKLRPSPAQASLFAETLEICWHLYNHALAERKSAYQERGETLAFARQCASLPTLKQTWHSLKRVHSQVLQDVLHRLQHAFDGFFRRLKAGASPGYPRFRGRGWYDSFTYRQWGNGAILTRGRLALSKIGAVRIVRDRPLQGTPKTCTIVRKADGWYAHIACELVPEPLPPTGKAVGVNVGLESFATLSDGTQIANPRLTGVIPITPGSTALSQRAEKRLCRVRKPHLLKPLRSISLLMRCRPRCLV